MMPLKIVIIAHNQIDFVKLEIEKIDLYSGVSDEDIIIIDNGSEDGLAEWLYAESYNYIICDKEDENGYAEILNTVIREFHIESDILIVVPSFVILPYSLEEMQRVLHAQKMTGAVSPTMIPLGSEIAKEYDAAITCVDDLKKSTAPLLRDIGKIGLEWGAVMLKGEMLKDIGEFDERITSCHSVMTDYFFQAILRGYRFLECGNAYFYDFKNCHLLRYGQDSSDWLILKEKWNMNYFNNIVNGNLISYIEKPEVEKFSVLEVGCDCGANLYEGVKASYPNAEIYGLEINEQAAKIASCLFPVQVGNIEDKTINFGDKKFDYIIFGDVLEHLHDPAGTIRYCRDLLKENGHILASIPNIMHYSIMQELLRGNFPYADAGLLDRTHIHFFTYNEIFKMFKAEGYGIEVIDAVIQKDPQKDHQQENGIVEKLMSVSEGAQEFMFYAFQYLLSARKLNE